MNKKEEIHNEINNIVNEKLCHRCGTCVGVCPQHAIKFNEEGYPEINSDLCIACGKCLRVCAGKDFDCNHFSKLLYDKQYDFKATHGNFEKAFLIASQDKTVREVGSSGGFITQLLISLLRQGVINGALVVVSDGKKLWKGKPIIAKSEEEIINATKSKYSIVSTNSVLGELYKLEGKYAVVGLPCQIQGIRKCCEVDLRLKDKIALTVGLFCHSSLEPELYESVWKDLGDEEKNINRFNPRKGKHPGVPTLEFNDGTSRPLFYANRGKYVPNSTELLNLFFRLYTQPRCFSCIDALSEFADISVGDPYFTIKQDIDLKEGWSFVLVRNQKALEYISNMDNAKEVILKEVSKENAQKCNLIMAKNKKSFAFHQIANRERQGKAVPKYTDNYINLQNFSFKNNIKYYFNYLTFYFCFLQKGRKTLLRILLGGCGYYLLLLNHIRKEFMNKIKGK